MITDISLTVFDLVIFLGVVQGIFISVFFIRSGRREVRPNLYQGLLIFCLAMVMLEELLNNTGYITRVLAISNFSEPFNFVFGPLVFLYIRNLLYPDTRKKDWPHFLLFAFWVLYMIPYFVQSADYKYNSYVMTKHPGWEYLEASTRFNDDPLHIRSLINPFTGIHFIAYLLAIFVVVGKHMKEQKERFLTLKDPKLKMARGVGLHFLLIVSIFVFVKLRFSADLGDYFISTYISFMIFATSVQVMRNSTFFGQPVFFLQFPGTKYEKSSLSQKEKMTIHRKILEEMEKEHYYTSNLASLSDLSRKLGESSHHVSQVINEVMGKGFFEMLAAYRVEEAQRLIREDRDGRMTVEEIAEEVGYNSKSSFNSAFKKRTGQTPSEFRRSQIL